MVISSNLNLPLYFSSNQSNPFWLIQSNTFWSNQIHFDPFKFILIQSNPLWSTLIHLDPLQFISIHSNLLRSNLIHFDLHAHLIKFWFTMIHFVPQKCNFHLQLFILIHFYAFHSFRWFKFWSVLISIAWPKCRSQPWHHSIAHALRKLKSFSQRPTGGAFNRIFLPFNDDLQKILFNRKCPQGLN